MFELENNKFIESNYCTYIDEYNNKAYMRREKNKIVAKLRFSDKRVRAKAMNIAFPVASDKKGDNIHLEYTDECLLSNKDIKAGIENFTQLINYWIYLLYDIALLDMKNDIFRKANGNISDEQIAEYKFSRLLPYKELKPVLNSL